MTRSRSNVIAVLQTLRGRRLTAEDVAVLLESYPNTVRRLLRAMTRAGIVRPCGTAKSNRRGTKPILFECVNLAPPEN
jgi:Fe2+ or Zn2+ uptake regulation protein